MGAWCCDMWLPLLSDGDVYLEYLLLSEWKLLVSLCYVLAKTRCYIRTTYIVAQLKLLDNSHYCTTHIVGQLTLLDSSHRCTAFIVVHLKPLHHFSLLHSLLCILTKLILLLVWKISYKLSLYLETYTTHAITVPAWQLLSV